MNEFEILQVVQAFTEGKTIEFFNGIQWKNTNNPSWNFHDFKYRTKAEPRTFYAIASEGRLSTFVIYEYKEDAENKLCKNEKLIKLLEVLE